MHGEWVPVGAGKVGAGCQWVPEGWVPGGKLPVGGGGCQVLVGCSGWQVRWVPGEVGASAGRCQVPVGAGCQVPVGAGCQ